MRLLYPRCEVFVRREYSAENGRLLVVKEELEGLRICKHIYQLCCNVRIPYLSVLDISPSLEYQPYEDVFLYRLQIAGIVPNQYHHDESTHGPTPYAARNSLVLSDMGTARSEYKIGFKKKNQYQVTNQIRSFT